MKAPRVVAIMTFKVISLMEDAIVNPRRYRKSAPLFCGLSGKPGILTTRRSFLKIISLGSDPLPLHRDPGPAISRSRDAIPF
jgi:hypothetical protein